MGQNDRCGVFVESRLDHLTGVNGASIDSAEAVIPHLILLFSVLDGDRPF